MTITWQVLCKIAGVTINIDANTSACQHDMWKFLCLYEPIKVTQASAPTFDLHFRVLQQDKLFSFLLLQQDEDHIMLWQSYDEREISAALEIHFYSNIIQYLDPDIVSIHAAVLQVKQQAVMFAGLSGAGKSSVCTAGLLSGAAYMSDEFSLLDGQGVMHPFPRPMQWEHPHHPAFDRDSIHKTGLIAADYFDFPDSEGVDTRCHLWHPQHIQRNSLPLTTIVLHGYNPDAQAAELLAIPRHEALLELPQHLHVQRGIAHDLPMLNQRIAKSCRFYRLPFSDVFAAWRIIAEEVEGKHKGRRHQDI